MGHPKRKLVFQPSIFRCENVSFREGNTILKSIPTLCQVFIHPRWCRISSIHSTISPLEKYLERLKHQSLGPDNSLTTTLHPAVTVFVGLSGKNHYSQVGETMVSQQVSSENFHSSPPKQWYQLTPKLEDP